MASLATQKETQLVKLKIDPGDSDNESSAVEDDKTETGRVTTDSKRKRTSIIVLIVIALIITTIAIILIVILTRPHESAQTAPESQHQYPYDRYLIILSVDGFRSEYFENQDFNIPNIRAIGDEGVYIKNMIPVYPSFTFPNHYTIVTGLYPGDHGIVSNSFWDPVLEDTFYKWSDDIDGRWYRGEPIWYTHRMPQNIANYSDYKSATVFWPGSDKNASGKGHPDFYMNYNGSLPFRKRMDTILDLLETGEYRLMMGYMNEPDSMGHEYGPDSQEVKEAAQDVDTRIGYLIDGIKNISMDLYDRTDVVVLSDHGMTAVSNQSLIHINRTDSFNISDSRYFNINAAWSALLIKLKTESIYTVEEVIEYLKQIIYPLDLVQIYDQDDIPFEYSSGYHDRIPDIVVVPPIGYQFVYDYKPRSEQTWTGDKGNHGYNNTEYDMSALFVARGPSFKSGYVKDKVENIHLYEMFCYIMEEMKPSSNNGSIQEIKDILS